MSVDLNPANLIFKDADGNTGYVRSLSNDDLVKLNQGVRVWSGATAYPEGYVVRSGTDLYQALSAVTAGTPLTDTTAWCKVASVSDLPGDATTEQAGLVELATTEEVAAGAVGKIPDAKQVNGLVTAVAETVENMIIVDETGLTVPGLSQGVILPQEERLMESPEVIVPRTGLAFAIGSMLDWYWRGALFTSARTTVTIPAGTQVHINGAGYILTSDRVLALDSAGTAAARAGHSVYIYARVPSSGLEPDFVLSLTELTGSDVRKIGGFYCINFAAGSASSVLAGYSNGDVLPGSEWDLLGHAASPLATGLTIFDLCPDGAGPHNALYRGKDITADFDSGKFSENVANGTFRDIFPGDYIRKDITVNGVTYPVKWVIGDCDYHYHYGDTELLTHHVLVFPDIALGTSYMNATNVTTGSYKGSYMWKTVIPQVNTGLLAAFTANHLVYTRQWLGTTVDTNAASAAMTTWKGVTSACEWTDVLACTMNEHMVYGRHASGSFYDEHDNPRVVAAFAHSPYIRYTTLDGVRFAWWLRSVASSTYFAIVNGYGSASHGNASYVHGVRPFCLIR